MKRQRVERTGTVHLVRDANGTRAVTAAEAAELQAAVERHPAKGAPAGDGEPCYGCACCTSWTGALEQLRAAVSQHEFRRVTGSGPCPEGCLVCQTNRGQW